MGAFDDFACSRTKEFGLSGCEYGLFVAILEA
jgi:hypothetical protein